MGIHNPVSTCCLFRGFEVNPRLPHVMLLHLVGFAIAALPTFNDVPHKLSGEKIVSRQLALALTLDAMGRSVEMVMHGESAPWLPSWPVHVG
jgi:hypothetical protein